MSSQLALDPSCDVWNEILVFLSNDDLACCNHVQLCEPSLITREAKCRTRKKTFSRDRDIRFFSNYGSLARFNSYHFCDHIDQMDQATHRFSHDRKNGEWEVMTVSLHLCSLCITYSMERFFRHHRALPHLRCHGSEVRYLIIRFLEDTDAQWRWLLDMRRLKVQTILPQNYHCRYGVQNASIVKQLLECC